MTKKIYLVFLLIMFLLPLSAEDHIRNELISYTTFPCVNIQFGSLLANQSLIFILTEQTDFYNNILIKKNESTIKITQKSEIYYNLAKLYQSQINFDKARDNFNHAKNIYLEILNNSNKTFIYPRLGEIYYYLSILNNDSIQSDNLAKAYFLIKKSLELKSNDYYLWQMLGDYFLINQNSAEASKCYNRSLNLGNTSCELYIRLKTINADLLIKKIQHDSTSNKQISINDIIDSIFIKHDKISTLETNRQILNFYDDFIFLKILLYIHESSDNKFNYTNIISLNEVKNILQKTEKLLNEIQIINPIFVHYLKGIIYYLNKDYHNTLSEFNFIYNKSEFRKYVSNDIIFIYLKKTFENEKLKSFLINNSHDNPSLDDFIILAGIEFTAKNFLESQKYCIQATKINKNDVKSYLGLAAIAIVTNNFVKADEMIMIAERQLKKYAGLNAFTSYQQNLILLKQNEAILSLLNNEKERAYICLRYILSNDTNNLIAKKLYTRFLNSGYNK